MASSSRKCIWKKDSHLAKVEFLVEESDRAAAEITSEITIINEGYTLAKVEETDVGIINLRCSGKLCVNKNDKGEFVVNPQDASDELTIYKLDVGERDKLQDQVILLESQLKKHHFLHWTVPGPSCSVTFQEFQRYDSDGPQVDINDDSDQRFVWVIPINQKGSNQFSMQPYEKSCHLTDISTTNADIGRAVLKEGSGNDCLKKFHHKP